MGFRMNDIKQSYMRRNDYKYFKKDSFVKQYRHENEFVSNVYKNLSNIYDVLYGPTLQHGRDLAIKRMPLSDNERVLEVGVGTGLGLELYPFKCMVTGIDFSNEMLKKAKRRISGRGMDNINLIQMDATNLEFEDASFDIVYAPYLMSVVSDPVKVMTEMYRVCRGGGRIILLNHFLSEKRWLSSIEKAVTPITVHIGFKSDLDLHDLLHRANIPSACVEKVNFAKICRLVTCYKH